MAMKKTLRHAACVSGLAMLFLWLPARPAAAQPIASDGTQLADDIAAIVNNDVITARELEQRAGVILRRLQQQKAPVPPLEHLREQVLSQMVLERVQIQRAKEDGIRIDDAAVQTAVQQLAQNNSMTVDQYQARLEAQGVGWPLFLSDVRTELTLAKLREKEVDRKITVSDAEVANYIAGQRGPDAQMEQDVRLEHIFVKAPLNAPQVEIEAARKRAEELLKQAQAATTDKDFQRLARRASEANDAKTGGDLGFKPQAQLPENISQAVRSLRVGQLNPELLRVPEGFEIVRVAERRRTQSAGAGPSIMQTHVRHILVRIGEGKSEQQVRQELLEIRQQIEAGGDFTKFARTYSQDGSASQGGDLGWISPGETVPEFERAMKNLQDGQISEPVRTEYGYHLIQVLERKETQGSAQRQMDIARQALGQRKAEQAYADWLRELRDSAYVEVKLGKSLPY